MSEDFALQLGESPIPNAPVLTLNEGQSCIPQHFLNYTHNLASVERVAKDIAFEDTYMLFVCQEHDSIYIQIGIIGPDNYVKHGQPNPNKIVYGRKWRIEPKLPTSEIIQTAFLAMSKAREHEVRERFRITLDGTTTTPFNTHHDAPLMARLSESDVLQDVDFERSAVATPEDLRACITRCLSTVSFDNAQFELDDILVRPNKPYIVDLILTPTRDTQLPEVSAQPLSLVLPDFSTNALYFALFDFCLSLSQSYVEERFSYKGFRRFSKDNDVLRIAELSYHTRRYTAEHSQFDHAFKQANYDTDTTRVPRIVLSEYGKTLEKRLASLDIEAGLLPSIESSD